MEKYEKVRVLGKGSFGSAILIKRKIDGALFVVKEIPMSKLSKKEKEDARKECSVLQKLHHPNIVRYVEQFENRNNLYIVMEYCDDSDLNEKVKKCKGFMEESSILYYFSQLCLAMEYLHSSHILHRDIKTMNVFLMKNGAVKLGDFGIARVLQNTVALANTVCGTPYYFSPELCRNKPYNTKGDMWSLGVLLYECAAGGRHPFDGSNIHQLMHRIVKIPHAPLSQNYSVEFRNLVDWCLQKDPARRPSIHQVLAYPLVRKALENLEENLLLATQCKIRLKDLMDFKVSNPKAPSAPNTLRSSSGVARLRMHLRPGQEAALGLSPAGPAFPLSSAILAKDEEAAASSSLGTPLRPSKESPKSIEVSSSSFDTPSRVDHPPPKKANPSESLQKLMENISKAQNVRRKFVKKNDQSPVVALKKVSDLGRSPSGAQARKPAYQSPYSQQVLNSRGVGSRAKVQAGSEGPYSKLVTSANSPQRFRSKLANEKIVQRVQDLNAIALIDFPEAQKARTPQPKTAQGGGFMRRWEANVAARASELEKGKPSGSMDRKPGSSRSPSAQSIFSFPQRPTPNYSSGDGGVSASKRSSSWDSMDELAEISKKRVNRIAGLRLSPIDESPFRIDPPVKSVSTAPQKPLPSHGGFTNRLNRTDLPTGEGWVGLTPRPRSVSAAVAISRREEKAERALEEELIENRSRPSGGLKTSPLESKQDGLVAQRAKYLPPSAERNGNGVSSRRDVGIIQALRAPPGPSRDSARTVSDVQSRAPSRPEEDAVLVDVDYEIPKNEASTDALPHPENEQKIHLNFLPSVDFSKRNPAVRPKHIPQEGEWQNNVIHRPFFDRDGDVYAGMSREVHNREEELYIENHRRISEGKNTVLPSVLETLRANRAEEGSQATFSFVTKRDSSSLSTLPAVATQSEVLSVDPSSGFTGSVVPSVSSSSEEVVQFEDGTSSEGYSEMLLYLKQVLRGKKSPAPSADEPDDSDNAAGKLNEKWEESLSNSVDRPKRELSHSSSLVYSWNDSEGGPLSKTASLSVNENLKEVDNFQGSSYQGGDSLFSSFLPAHPNERYNQPKSFELSVG